MAIWQRTISVRGVFVRKKSWPRDQPTPVPPSGGEALLEDTPGGYGIAQDILGHKSPDHAETSTPALEIAASLRLFERISCASGQNCATPAITRTARHLASRSGPPRTNHLGKAGPSPARPSLMIGERLPTAARARTRRAGSIIATGSTTSLEPSLTCPRSCRSRASVWTHSPSGSRSWI